MTLMERITQGFNVFEVTKNFVEKDYDVDYEGDYYYFNSNKLDGHSIMNGLFYQCCDYKNDSISSHLDFEDILSRNNYFWLSLNQKDDNGHLICLYPTHDNDENYIRYCFNVDETVDLYSAEGHVKLETLISADDIFNARIQNFYVQLTEEELKVINGYIKKYSKYYDMYGFDIEIVL
ncbi:hypothetical protein XaC1_106 [Xanthomonas phage XaC1]|nr:hypothetical protein XaC1_106 [Xanthomonas phage XaC1]